MTTNRISGIHHVTAIASDPQRTLDFYTQAMGLRLVKLTVNFDDPGTYHFYFGDEVGSPGTILTFFPWPHVPQGEIGTGQVTTIAFEVHALRGFHSATLSERDATATERLVEFMGFTRIGETGHRITSGSPAASCSKSPPIRRGSRLTKRSTTWESD